MAPLVLDQNSSRSHTVRAITGTTWDPPTKTQMDATTTKTDVLMNGPPWQQFTEKPGARPETLAFAKSLN